MGVREHEHVTMRACEQMEYLILVYILEYFIHADGIFLLYSLRHDKIFYFVKKNHVTMEKYSTMSYIKKLRHR
jgi:hypothetical protein